MVETGAVEANCDPDWGSSFPENRALIMNVWEEVLDDTYLSSRGSHQHSAVSVIIR